MIEIQGKNTTNYKLKEGYFNYVAREVIIVSLSSKKRSLTSFACVTKQNITRILTRLWSVRISLISDKR